MSATNGKNGRANGRAKPAAKKARRKPAARKKAKKPIGRPPKLTRTFLAAFVAVIAAGNYRNTAANVLGVADSTVRAWMRQGEQDADQRKKTLAAEFSAAVVRAEAQAESDMVEVVRTAATGWTKTIEVVERTTRGTGKDAVTVEKVKRQTVLERDPQCAQWWLERKAKDRFGRFEKVEQNVAVTGEQTHTLKLVSDGIEKLGKRFDHRMVGLS